MGKMPEAQNFLIPPRTIVHSTVRQYGITAIRKLVLVLEEEVDFDLHLVSDLDLHSVENITMT